MIETLDGIFETVNCKQRTTVKLYDNKEYEDYPRHWHPAFEIIMPVENGYELEFNNVNVHLREGDICIICPGCVHSIKAPETGRRIIFQPNTNHLRFMRDVDVLISILSPYAVIQKESAPQIYDRIHELMLEICKEYMEGAPFSEVMIYSKLLEFFALIGRNYSMNQIQSGEYNPAVREEYALKFMEVCDYIREHCAEDLNLDDIASRCGFSKFYFERLFKQFTGVTFYKYVNQKRIAKAQELLVEPGNSVTDVALNCGFTSISSFIRMFKLHKGCTPTEFKSMYWFKDMDKMILEAREKK